MKFVKKLLPLTLIFMAIFSTLPTGTVNASNKPPFEVNSKVAYLVNTDTDTVVYEKNADEKIYPASLTKIMTTILAIEMIPDLENTILTAQPYLFDEFYGLGVSTADIRPYEQVRAIDVLYGVMLPSACEGSSIIADYLGDGNISEFVEMMNKKAKELGCTNTNFTNAHGLFNEAQVTTAKDMYLITKYAMENPMFEKIATTKSYQMPATNKHANPYYVLHTNAMMSKERSGEYYYQHIRGIKTGTLPEVGKNLVSTATLDGYNYILVTMGAPEKDAEGKPLPNGAYIDAKALYNWAFSNFTQQTIMNAGDVISEAKIALSSEQDYVTLVAKNNAYALLPRGADRSTIQQIVTVKEGLIAPVKKGTPLGVVELKLSGETIKSVDLIALEDIKRSGLLYSIDVTKRFFSQGIVIVLLIVIILMIFTFMALNARYKKLKRKRAAYYRAIHRG